jgi:hypothetical protein
MDGMVSSLCVWYRTARQRNKRRIATPSYHGDCPGVARTCGWSLKQRQIPNILVPDLVDVDRPRPTEDDEPQRPRFAETRFLKFLMREKKKKKKFDLSSSWFTALGQLDWILLMSLGKN